MLSKLIINVTCLQLVCLKSASAFCLDFAWVMINPYPANVENMVSF